MAHAMLGAQASLLKARGKSERDKALVRELFSYADQNKDGRLDYKEYADLMRSKGMSITDPEVKYLFEMADKNEDRNLVMAEIMESTDAKERIQNDKAFSIYDKNQDGLVTKNEVLQFSGGILTKEQIDKAFLLHDKDGDGKLNKTEMANMIARGKRAKAEKDAREQSGKHRSAKKS